MNLPDIGAWLREHKDDSAELLLRRVEVSDLNAELGRLRQSNDRMRKQNAKLRKRIAKFKAGDATAFDAIEEDSDS